MPWKRKWQSTLVFLPGKSYGQRSLEGYSPWDHKNSHTRLSDSVKFSRSVVSDSVTAWTSMPGFPIHHQLLEPIQTHVHRVGDAIQLPHLLSSPFPPALNLSLHQGFFSQESVLLIRWPKYWSFSFSISPSNEHSGLISFTIDSFDLLAVQGALKSLLQHHISKASIHRRSAFFIVQLWHPYITTGKTIALIRWGSVEKVMSMLFNMLSVGQSFLPRSNCLLISWLQSLSAVILEPKEIKSLTVSIDWC